MFTKKQKWNFPVDFQIYVNKNSHTSKLSRT